jgi:hypothetical protein
MGSSASTPSNPVEQLAQPQAQLDDAFWASLFLHRHDQIFTVFTAEHVRALLEKNPERAVMLLEKV